MSKNDEPKILLDSDVVRHFISGGQILLLPSIFPGRFIMLDKVKNELCRSRSIEPIVNNFLSMTHVDVIPFPTDREVVIEYAYLTRQFGEGESACMAVARYQAQFIASSNLKDIRNYCEQHVITYLTTMDILKSAYDQRKLNKAQCDQFITDVLSKGSRLPFKTMDSYLASLV